MRILNPSQVTFETVAISYGLLHPQGTSFFFPILSHSINKLFLNKYFCWIIQVFCVISSQFQYSSDYSSRKSSRRFRMEISLSYQPSPKPSLLLTQKYVVQLTDSKSQKKKDIAKCSMQNETKDYKDYKEKILPRTIHSTKKCHEHKSLFFCLRLFVRTII